MSNVQAKIGKWCSKTLDVLFNITMIGFMGILFAICIMHEMYIVAGFMICTGLLVIGANWGNQAKHESESLQK